jgi:hypothetical protein
MERTLHGIGRRAIYAIILALLTVSLGTRTVAGQVQRQPAATATAQTDMARVKAMVDPLKTEVESLRQEVNRLKAALESLRQSVVNKQTFATHTHPIPYYGKTSAKTIAPGTNVSDDTMVLIWFPSAAKTMPTGTPEKPE